MMTPGSSYRKTQQNASTYKLESEGTPSFSAARSVRTKNESLTKSAMMADVTNVTRALLPRPRRLNLNNNDENQRNSQESWEQVSPQSSTKLKTHEVPSSIQKHREELERHNHTTRLEREMRDVQLGRITQITALSVQTPVMSESSNNTIELLLSPNDLESGVMRTKHSMGSRKLKRFWELLYAVLAILELLSCQGFQNAFQLGRPKAFVPPTASSVHPVSQNKQSPTRMTPPAFGVTETRGYWGQNVSGVIKRNLESEWIRRIYNMSWQELINKMFMVALFVHTVMESWALASSSNNEKRQREEQKALQSASKVTRRSKRRFQNLETTSSNRHFIMRWTRNRIRWSKATTEIFRASCIILLLRLLFLPILKRNRVVTIDQNSRDASMIPFISPLYVPKQGLEMTVDIAGRTLSFGESVIMDVALWLHSCAVAHFRRKVKEYTLRFMTLALTRPWEASAHVQNLFTLIRWTKFLAPLIGTFNKLRGHVNDYKQKRDRRCRSDRAKLLWSNLIRVVLAEKLAERAVRQIQRHFRIRQQRTRSQRLISSQDMAVEEAVIKIQRRFRARATVSRIRVTRAKRRLSEIGVGQQIISYEHRELADSLRREIRERSRLNRRLLLRPNTVFSLTWKRTTIACVLVEISHKILAPMMAPKTGKLTLDELFFHLLTPAAERLAPLSWHQVSFIAVEFFSRRVADLVSMVSFLDVFITFFTGELDEKTGVLIPKHFFARWILPGVVLQLIVNPTMKDISAVVKKVLAFSKNVGPMRVFHVALALFPIFRAIVLWIIDLVYQFVDSENRNVRRSHKFSTVM